MKADIRQTGASKDTFFECSFSFFTEKKEIECTKTNLWETINLRQEKKLIIYLWLF